MHHPTDIRGELGRFGAGQHHAVVERVQEAPLRNPAFLFHQVMVHDRDLPGRPAEADEAELEPVPERFGQGYGRWRRVCWGYCVHAGAPAIQNDGSDEGFQVCASSRPSLHHAYRASYITIPCSSISWSSLKIRDSPSEMAANPAACGARSSWWVSAPRTIAASC